MKSLFKATIRSDSAIKLATSSSNSLEQAVRTQLVNSLCTHFLQLAGHFATTCAFLTRVHNTDLYRIMHELRLIKSIRSPLWDFGIRRR